MWKVLAGGTPEEFGNTLPSITELPHGTPIKLEIKTTLPVAPIADVVGAEWFAEQMGLEGAAVVDVEATGWDTVVVHMVADPVWVWLLMLAILAGIGGLIYLVYEIRLLANVAGPTLGIGLVLLGGGALLGGILVGRALRRRA